MCPSAGPSWSAESRPAPGAPGTGKIRLLVAYDGSGFHGMAVNEGVRTVAGVLTDALERVVGHQVVLSVAGRTDKGVHAQGQVVSFATDRLLDLADLVRSLNAMCGPEVVVRDAEVVSDDFDARFSARSRSYRYTVLARPVPDPFLDRVAWWVAEPLDLASMRLGCDPLIGLHDFSSFCRRPKGTGDQVSLERRVLDATWHDVGDGVLRFDVTATAFCHQMVRSIVGTLVEMGRGRRRAGEMTGILKARDRGAVTTIAPPHGLCLWSVAY